MKNKYIYKAVLGPKDSNSVFTFLLMFFGMYNSVFCLEDSLAKEIRNQWSEQHLVKIQRVLNKTEDKAVYTLLEEKVREGLVKKAPAERVLSILEKRESTLAKLAKESTGSDQLSKRLHQMEMREFVSQRSELHNQREGKYSPASGKTNLKDNSIPRTPFEKPNRPSESESEYTKQNRPTFIREEDRRESVRHLYEQGREDRKDRKDLLQEQYKERIEQKSEMRENWRHEQRQKREEMKENKIEQEDNKREALKEQRKDRIDALKEKHKTDRD